MCRTEAAAAQRVARHQDKGALAEQPASGQAAGSPGPSPSPSPSPSRSPPSAAHQLLAGAAHVGRLHGDARPGADRHNA
jgi:hypothetical protein